MVENLKAKNISVDKSVRPVVVSSSKICEDSKDAIEPLLEVSREERKREASKPLYLVRYE
jgi:hypothetical protein